MVRPNLEKVMHLMIEEAGNPATPVVAVSKSGWPHEAVVSASMGTVAAFIAERGLKEPIIYFIGKTAVGVKSYLKMREFYDGYYNVPRVMTMSPILLKKISPYEHL